VTEIANDVHYQKNLFSELSGIFLRKRTTKGEKEEEGLKNSVVMIRLGSEIELVITQGLQPRK